METIFAVATARGRAGVSVIRVSGKDSALAVQALTGKGCTPRMANLRKLTSSDGRVLDEALVLYFPAPASFTGEDVVEFQIHGSPAIESAVLRELSGLDGFSLAEPGEFTRRALMNGKLDLTQVEGLADLIEAQTEAQRVQAQRVFSGEFRDVTEGIRNPLVRATSLLEAVIDFADEDVPEDVSEEAVSLIDEAVSYIEDQLRGQRFAERVRSGFEVAIVGAPNVGKSTLLNALAGREAAITSHFAGTTRDVIEVQMDLDGIPVTFLDTAGLRETSDPVEKIGISKARDRAAGADIRVFLSEDGTETDFPQQPGDIVLRAKMDEARGELNGISGKTGVGVERLVRLLTDELSVRVASAGLATRERHLSAFIRSLDNLTVAKSLILVGTDEYDIAAEELRSSLRSLDSVIGRVDVENLLDEIFSSFCLGK